MSNISLPLLCLALGLSSPAFADSVQVENAWIRATAPGQKVAGGFMALTADADMAVVGGSSPASATLELHMMKMKDGMMEMRQVKEIALPKGRTVNLEPGGLHIMFINLRAPLKEGDRVPVNLTVKGKDGKEQTVAVSAEVRKSGGMAHHH